MVRELRRLLIDPGRLAETGAHHGRVPLGREEEHYLSRVLRLRPGDAVTVIDGCGGQWRAQRGGGAWLEALQSEGEPQMPPIPRLSLALALPRQDVELVWRMATELGIDRLQPLLADRCQGSGRRPALERWAAVVREATEQCERLWLPQLASLRTAEESFTASRGGLKLLATTRREHLPALEALLAQAGRPGNDLEEITLAVGPEGGWSPQEEQLAEAAGWRAVSLGETILRTTTAAVAGASRLVAWRQVSC